jgi:hypothetical protein
MKLMNELRGWLQERRDDTVLYLEVYRMQRI